MSDLTLKYYPRQCKGKIGGIKKVYLFPFYEFLPNEIETDSNVLTVFPDACVVEYNVNGSFTEQTETTKRNYSVNQSLNFDLSDIYNNIDPYIFMAQEFRALVLTNNNDLILLGLRNGLDSEIQNTTGTDKAGGGNFSITMTGKESEHAVYVNSFDDFFSLCDNQNDFFNYTFDFNI